MIPPSRDRVSQDREQGQEIFISQEFQKKEERTEGVLMVGKCIKGKAWTLDLPDYIIVLTVIVQTVIHACY